MEHEETTDSIPGSPQLVPQLGEGWNCHRVLSSLQDPCSICRLWCLSIRGLAEAQLGGQRDQLCLEDKVSVWG